MQFANPVLHVATAQAEGVPLQAAVPFAAVHVTPQPPQLLLEVRLVSQPLVAMVSQLPYPAVQAPSTQAPAEQVAAAFGKVQA